MTPRLPQELVDQAIDHLWRDTESLAACALTSQGWLPTARTHLFHSQRLTGAKCCARFEAFLDSSPEVSKYIRKLSVTEPMSTAYAQNWVNRIPELVARLERLSTLELVGLHYVSLQYCSPRSLAAFSKLSELVFADVYFDHFLDVQTILTAAHNTTNLCFYRVGWGNCTPPAYERRPEPVALKLRRLVVDSWAASIVFREWLLPSAEKGQFDLRTLLVRWRERDSVDILNAVFRTCGKALEHLYIELPTTTEGSPEAPTLSHNTNLRSLEIDGLVLPGCGAHALALLAQLRTSQLHKLSISMLVLRNDVLSSFAWDELESILSRPQFSEAALTITVNRALHPHNDPSAIRATVAAYLPGLAQRGKLSINCS